MRLLAHWFHSVKSVVSAAVLSTLSLSGCPSWTDLHKTIPNCSSWRGCQNLISDHYWQAPTPNCVRQILLMSCTPSWRGIVLSFNELGPKGMPAFLPPRPIFGMSLQSRSQIVVHVHMSDKTSADCIPLHAQIRATTKWHRRLKWWDPFLQVDKIWWIV